MELEYRVAAEEAGLALGAFLRRRGLSLAVVRALKWQPAGLVVNGAPARTNLVLHAGDTVLLHPAPGAEFSALPQDIPLHIVYESADALVVDKPAGMATHPGPSHRQGTVANAYCGLVQQRLQEGPGGYAADKVFRPIGRLDAGTSGLLLCALHAAAARPLAQSSRKAYLALVQGCPPQKAGQIDAPLAPAPGSAVLQQAGSGGRAALTRYRVLAKAPGASLVLAVPVTGRTHQIRAHMAHIGCALLGDALYGGDTTLLQRPALHCWRLGFAGLHGGPVRLACPPSQDMAAAAEALGLTFAILPGVPWEV